MPIILRAILTGFGYKLGAELARYVTDRIGLHKSDNEDEADAPKDIDEPEDGGPQPKPPSTETSKDAGEPHL